MHMSKRRNQSSREELNGIYTPLSIAKKEIWKRWNDKKLKKKVKDFLDGDVPEIFKKAPMAALGRHVLTPNFELLRFRDLSRMINLEPVCLEYLKDKLATENIDKYYLCKLFFYNGDSKKGKCRLSIFKVMDLGDIDRKRLSDLKTTWGESLVDFHHEIADSLDLSRDIRCFDMSDYLKRKGGTSDKYYLYYLCLFICYGVLFENYLLGMGQTGFTEETVLPYFKKVTDIFGLKPLIVPIVPVDDEEQLYWKYYAGPLRDKISSLVKLKI